MVAKEPAEAGQPAKPRRNRRENATPKPPANEARSPSATANGHPAPGQGDEGEGFHEARADSPEGFSEPLTAEPLPAELVRTQQQSTTAGRPPPSLGRARVSRPIHVNTARFYIALCALATLMFVVVASFVSLWVFHVAAEDLMRLLEVLFAPLIALVGIAVAFYYSRDRDRGGNPPIG